MTTSIPASENKATITYKLTFSTSDTPLTGEKTTTSRNPVASFWYQSKAEPKGSTFADTYQHSKDAELLLLDYLAEKVVAKFEVAADDGWGVVGKGGKQKAASPEEVRAIQQKVYEGAGKVAKGEVTIFSDFGPCHSCRDVINQFRREFPNVKVIIKYRKPDGDNPLMAAGTGMYGTYGCGDAVREKAVWVKVFEPLNGQT